MQQTPSIAGAGKVRESPWPRLALFVGLPFATIFVLLFMLVVVSGGAESTIGAGVWLVTLLFSVIVGLPLYLVPTMIAVAKNRRQKVAIIALNVLLGWTFLGWVGALVWSLIEDG